MGESRPRSRKLSAASSLWQRSLPDLFLDRSLGRNRVAEALRKAGAKVHVHHDHFPDNSPDVDWLTAVGRKGWVVLTKDNKIRFRTLERDALAEAGVAAFILRAKDLQGKEMGEAFVKALPEMSTLLASERKPFIATVTRDGKVALLS